MTIFLDTDILLDFLGDRKPFSKYAAIIFQSAYQKKLTIYSSSNSITTCYYILGQYCADKKASFLILNLLDEISVIPVSEDILVKAFDSNFSDAEDAVQHFSALSIEAVSCIITRNLKDYKHSKLPVHSSEEFVLKYIN